MKNLYITLRLSTYLLLVYFIVPLWSVAKPAESSFYFRLETLENVRIVKKVTDFIHYTEAYEIRIVQPLDHNNPDGKTFEQKIFVSHCDFSRPMVLVTSGYNVDFNSASELSRILHSNQIIIEHRYYGESCPIPVNWEYLTVEQSVKDVHHVVELFKKLYYNKWISTGVSKGGQTALYHRKFFPNDVDITVPYVAPVVLSDNDTRLTDFLNNVGDKSCRDKIRNFQMMLLKERDTYIPLFKQACAKNDDNFSVYSVEAAYEYAVLEYEFSFWQWGDNCDEIPDSSSTPEYILEKLLSSALFFSDKSIEELQPFFYQALTEVGFYNYNTTPFKENLKYIKIPTFSLFSPESATHGFNAQTINDINNWLTNNGNNILYIYGEIDTWTAFAITPGNNTNAVKMVKKKGSHTTRIKNFEGDQLKKIYDTLEVWLECKIEQKTD